MTYSSLEHTTLGRYDLRELLSKEGGLIATYKAYQPSLKRLLAIQVLNPDAEVAPQSFGHAGEIMAGLEHANIVPVHDFGTEGGFAFIALRLMAGGSLRARLKASPMSVQESVAVVKQISGALEYVHSRGLTHGDPSVANIVFDGWGSAYVADFHVAGLRGSMADGRFIGTPAYTAPEKFVSNLATPRTDQYALAAIAYEMMTGTPPFAGEVPTVVYKHATELPAPPHTRNAEIPQAMSDVLLRALAKKPEERYLTMMDFARELEKAARARPRHLFLSYSRQDADYARRLDARLSESGFTVSRDTDIEYGEAWFERIDETLRACAAVVLVMSPAARESEWVQKEILLAKRYRKPLFPVLLKGDEFPIVIDLQFADVRDGGLPDAGFHRRLRQAVDGEA